MIASITTWTPKLEPRTRSHDGMDAGLQAGVLDPLWMLTRQWHLGEFQAEDAGTAVAATAQVTSGPLSRYRAAGSPAARDYPRAAPLESLVQRDQVARGTGALARLAVDVGLHFLRLLGAQPNLKHYQGGYLAAYPLAAPAGSGTVNADASRYLGVMTGRALDGGRLCRTSSRRWSRRAGASRRPPVPSHRAAGAVPSRWQRPG